jgi:cytoskeletal protein RodZ
MSSRNKLRVHSPKKSKFRLGPKIILLFFLVLISVGVLGAMVLFETEMPRVTLQENIRYLGKTSSISVRVSDRDLPKRMQSLNSTAKKPN